MPCHSRQTTLSRNDHGQLIVGDRCRATCVSHKIVNQAATRQVYEHENLTDEAYIFRLPDELLVLIIEITTYDNQPQSPWAIRECMKCWGLLSILLRVFTDRANCGQKLRTAPFTSLPLSNYQESSRATALLLSWPKVLEHLDFGSF